MPLTPWPMIVALTLLLILPPAAALLLRWAGMRSGCWILGGILAGILMGPTVAGHLQSSFLRDAVRGQHKDDATRRQTLQRHQAELIVAQNDQLTVQEILALRERHGRELAVIDLQLQRAIDEYQQPIRFMTLVLAALLLVCGGANPVPRPAQAQPWLHPAGVGFTAFTVPAAIAMAFCHWLWELPLYESLMASAALSVGPWILNHSDRTAADDAEVGGARMVQTAGRIACGLSVLAAMTAIILCLGRRDAWLTAPLLCAPVGWWVFRHSRGSSITQWLVRSCNVIATPALAASVMLLIDLPLHIHVWITLVILVISDDGRWLGAFAGAMSLGGRRPLRTMRLVLGIVSAGPTQLAFTAFGAWTGILSPATALALVLGAALIEITSGWRRGVAPRIIELEDEVDRARREESDVDGLS